MPKNVQEKVKVQVPDSFQPHGLYSPWNSPGQNTEAVAFTFSRGSSQPRDWTQVAHIAGGFFTSWVTRETQECLNYGTTVLISHASKAMFKILQARLQQYMNWELLDVQAGFRKGRGIRDQIANICWIMEKSKGIPEKHLLLLHWLC